MGMDSVKMYLWLSAYSFFIDRTLILCSTNSLRMLLIIDQILRSLKEKYSLLENIFADHSTRIVSFAANLKILC